MKKEEHGLGVARQKLERGQVGIAGEYAVLTQLIINGFAAGRTDGNSKDIDIVCSHVQTGRTANVQVKTLNPDTDYSRKNYQRFKFRIANRDNYDDMLEKKIATIIEKRIYYIFCALENPEYPGREKNRYFIATPEEVASQIKERAKRKTSIIDFIIQDSFDSEDEKVGKGLIENYEDRWMKLGN